MNNAKRKKKKRRVRDMAQLIKMLFLHKFMIETIHPKYNPTGILGKELLCSVILK